MAAIKNVWFNIVLRCNNSSLSVPYSARRIAISSRGDIPGSLISHPCRRGECFSQVVYANATLGALRYCPEMQVRKKWCPRSESNRHSRRNAILSRARLPVPPLGHAPSSIARALAFANSYWRGCGFPLSAGDYLILVKRRYLAKMSLYVSSSMGCKEFNISAFTCSSPMEISFPTISASRGL